jgi:hypothetical protein
VLVAAADGDVVATLGSMTTVGDDAESDARTMTVLVEVDPVDNSAESGVPR